MRFQHTNSKGSLVILQHGVEVGYVNGSRVGFHGFSNPSDASWAAWEAYRALESRHKGVRLVTREEEGFLSLEPGDVVYVVAEGAGRIARLIPPAIPALHGGGWGFEMDMAKRAEVQRTLHEVFLTANARVMWQGIRNSGRGHSMESRENQLAERASASN